MKHVFAPHQRKAFSYARARKRVALFMEMRLGKTPVAIRWAKWTQAKRVLLVGPINTLVGKLNWVGELKRESITPTVLVGLSKDRRWPLIRTSRITDCFLMRAWATGWFAVNYEALLAQPDILNAPWDAIILDESTKIRNPRAQITKLLLKDTSHIPYRAILTGLPNPESPLDYFTQFQFLHGHFMHFDNFYIFRQKLFHTLYTEWDWSPKPKVRDRIKQYVHDHAFVLTRKQAGVGSRKIRQQRSVELNAAQRKLMKEIKKKFAIEEHETKWVTVLHTWLQRIAGGFHPITRGLISDAKVQLAESLITKDFRKEPLVLWFRFNDEIEFLYHWMRKRHPDIKIGFIHGEIDKHQRARIQEQFQAGKLQVLLMQVKIRFGWDLSRSSTAIYYSNSYEFEDRSQSEDRIIHLKKKDDCLYLDLVTLDTPDEDVVDALSDKRITSRQFNTRLNHAAVEYVTGGRL